MIETTLQVVGRWISPLMLLALAGCQSKGDTESVDGTVPGAEEPAATQMDVAVGEAIDVSSAEPTLLPTLTSLAATNSYTEGDSATTLDNNINVASIGENVTSASITISSGFDSTDDVLAATAPGGSGITVNYSGGVLSLTGSGSPADYETTLESATYTNTDGNDPTATSRVFSYSVTNASGTATGSQTMTVTAVNDPPTLSVADTTVTTNEDTAYTFNATNSSLISIADVDIRSQSAKMTITATNGTVTLASISGLSFTTGDGTADASLIFTGTVTNVNTALNGMSFTPSTNSTSAGTVAIEVSDQGYAEDNVVDATALTDDDTITVTVTSLNDAPVLTAASIADFSSITEDNTTNSTTVSTLLSTGVSDGDTGAVEGIAIHTTASSNGTWYYSTDCSSFTVFPSVSSAAALLLAEDDCIRFLPNQQNSGSGSISFYAWDQTTGTAGSTASVATRGTTTAFSSSGDDSAITVTAVNDAPTLTAASVADFTSITEDNTTNSTLVSALLSTAQDDVDTSATEGIAIYNTTTSNGSWYYSTDCSSFTVFPAVSGTGALLLHSDDCIRFLPNEQNAGSGTIEFYGWDRTTGTAGSTATVATRGTTTAFSTTGGDSAITTTAANDAPVLVAASIVDFAAVSEDDSAGTATLVSTLLGSAVSDVDSSPSEGMAIYSESSTYGKWQYNTDASCSSAGTWTDLPTVTTSAAQLLAADDCVRYVPDGQNGGTGSITFYAWDTTTGTAGSTASVTSTGTTTAFSSTAGVSDITINAVNDAPVLTGTVDNFATITEDNETNSTLVSDLLDSTVSDVDSGAVEGIAIYSETADSGSKWQYSTASDCSTNTSATFTNFPSVSTSGALLLGSDDCIRYKSKGTTAETGSISYYAWDQSAGTLASSSTAVTSRGSTTAFSSTGGTSSITVTAQNDAPTVTTSVSLSLTGTDEDTTSTGMTVAAILASGSGDPISDDDTSAVEGIAIYSETSNGTWYYSTNGGTSYTAISSVSSSAALLLAANNANNMIRYVPDSQNGETATLSFYAWDQTTGTDGSTASVSSRGGTTAFSSSGTSASITVTSVNDAPTLTAASIQNFSSITEDNTTNATLVSSLLGTGVDDVDTSAAEGVAIYSASATNGTWYYNTASSCTSSGTWTALPSVTTSAAQLLHSDDCLRFLPNEQNSGTGSITFYAWDRTTGTVGSTASVTTTGTTTAFSSTAGSSSITVTAVNDAPVLTAASVQDFTTIDEDNTTNSTLVSALLSSSVSDVDTSAVEGIAIYAKTGNGTWYYSTDCSTYTAIGTPSTSAARLLAEDDCVRYVPDGKNGETATISFYAWDQTTGTAGSTSSVTSTGTTTAFSSTADGSSITVTSVNDAPTVTTASISNFSSITEDNTTNSTLVSTLLSTGVDDVDTSAVEGVAIYSLTSSNGTWQYNTSSSCTSSGTWTDIGTVTTSSALLLNSDDCLRFVPDQRNSDSASVTYYAWDRSDSNTAGNKVAATTTGTTTAFSSTAATSSLTITAVNDAPTLTTGSLQNFTTITEDDTTNSTTVSSLLSTAQDDVDNSAVEGIAIYSETSNGSWYYATDSTCSTFTVFPTVTTSAALLLAADDCIRYDPDDKNGETATITYYAWDRSSGTGGSTASVTSTGTTTAFSTSAGTSSIIVTDVNDAPVVTTTVSLSLGSTTEDATSTARNISYILGSGTSDPVSDVDTGAVEGIAVFSVSGNGTWQYSTDGGSTYSDLSVSSSAARLLSTSSSNLIRYVPDSKNSETPYISFYAWDRTSGTDGSTASVSSSLSRGTTNPFSSDGTTASLTVTAVNDAPVLNVTSYTLTTITEDSTATYLVSAFLDSSASDEISDVDNSASEGIAIYSATNSNGKWQYNTSSSCTSSGTWSDVGSPTTSAARLLEASDCIRFVPDAKNSDSVSFSFHAWDTTSGTAGSTSSVTSTGTTTAFSTATGVVALTVTAVNDAPVLDTSKTPVLTSITEDNTACSLNTISTVVGSGVSDVDNSAVYGIAIYGKTGNGTWQYSLDGTTRTSLPTVAEGTSLLLNSDDFLCYIPDEENGETATLTFYVWDRTDSNTAGNQASASNRGTTYAYSTNGDTISITVTDVDDDPVAFATYSVLVDGGTQTVTLSADGDYDSDPSDDDDEASVDVDDDEDVCEWKWTYVSGSFVTLTLASPCTKEDPGNNGGSDDCVDPSYVATSGTVWQLEVRSADGGDCSDPADGEWSDPVTVNVQLENLEPTASIVGSTMDIPIGAPIELDGTGSSDPDGTIDEYLWTISTSDDAPPGLADGKDDNGDWLIYFTDSTSASNTSTSAEPKIIVNENFITELSSTTGQVTVTLTVTDNAGDTATDSIVLSICAGYFDDDDGDKYGDPGDYYVLCSGTPSPPAGYIKQDTTVDTAAWADFDCLDNGSITDGSETINAVNVANQILWYPDEDADLYGDPGEPYSDGYDCVTTQPTSPVTHVLNDEDCNDDDGAYTTGAGETLSASEQNPETKWYIDIDGDGFGADNTSTTIYVVPGMDDDDNDTMCYCSATSKCGTLSNCTSYSSASGSTTITSTCEPYDKDNPTTEDCQIPSQIVQCEDPSNIAADTAGEKYFNPDEDGDDTPDYVDAENNTLLTFWVLDNGDCNEAAIGANDEADERCDPTDIDENCDGYADDDQPNKSIIANVFEFYADADNDGFGEENDVEASCEAAEETGRSSYQFYTITADAVATNSYYAYIDNDDSSKSCYCQDAAGVTCFDIDGEECNPEGTLELVDAEAGEAECMCYRSDCTGTCLNLAHDVCTPDSAGTCTEDTNFVNPGWFTDSDGNYYFDQFDCEDEDDTVYPGAEELCDGQLNDCYVESGATPDDEIDYDNDDYVACGYTTGWAGGATSEPNVGTDCSPDDKRVYPSAEEYCDGQFNDCDLWVDQYADATGDCFCDSETCGGTGAFCVDSTGNTCTPSTTVTATTVYEDTDGDCFCGASTLTGLCVDGEGTACDPDGSSGTATSYSYTGKSADDEVCYCPAASTSGCLNDEGRSCTPTATPVSLLTHMDCAPTGNTMSSGAPTDETDEDKDCYVDCYDGTTSWKGGDALLGETCTGPKPEKGEDCDDEDNTVYPGASEVCDGQLNNCNTSSLPTNETDDDSDGYVECTYVSTTWSGSGSVIGGDDCDDAYNLTYPGANESCDGKFNDCDHFLLENYAGVVGTGCFCDSSDGTATSCVDTAGASCDPDADNDGDIDSYLKTTTTIGATTYGSAAYNASTACYCPTSDCAVDQDFDDNSDCYTAAGAACSIDSLDEDGDGYADDCIQAPIDPSTGTAFTRASPSGFIFSKSGTGSTAKTYTPPGEYDDDNDRYVECDDYAASTWKGVATVKGGSDCDDSYVRTFPSATEYCDGEYNDCDDPAADPDSAPTDETDDDEDGFVDCSPTTGITWHGDTRPNPYFTATASTNLYYYADETEACFCSTATGPSSDGLTWTCGTTCVNASGTTCTPTDFDGDGTVECTAEGGYKDCDDTDDAVYPDAPKACDGQYNDCTASDYSATTSPSDETDNDADGYAECVGLDDTDCDDTDATRYPGADEACDGQFNDCLHFLLSDFEGATTTGCSCSTSDGSTGGSVCTTSIGALCDPADSNSDGFADNFVNTHSGGDYDSVEVACYCPSSDCLVDIDGDNLSDCFDPAGSRCEIEDIDLDEDGYADDCIASPLNPNAVAEGDVLAHDMQTISGWKWTSALSGAPPDETDDDSDRYVECEYVKETWQGAANILGGEDCDDLSSWAKYVTPSATVNEYCDGVFNDCNDPSYDGDSAPADELDDDGDGYVECTKESTTNGAWKRPNTDPSRYADEDGDCFCSSRSSDNLCGGTCLDEEGATCTPTDSNGDTFTTCYDAGGFVDCDDTDGTVYPAADEICDGQYNNCSSASYSATGAPTDETDNDADKYVECEAVFGTATCLCTDEDEDYSDCTAPDGAPCTHEEAPSLLWNGVADAPDGGGDCDDTDETRYPTAPEECDGLFNNCDHFLLSEYEGAIGTGCYCKSEDGSFTTTSCKTLNDSGVPVACTPVDVLKADGSAGSDNIMDNFVGVEKVLGTTEYSTEDLGTNPCFCPTADCLVDSDADSLSDCYDLTGARCEIEDIDTDDDGFADDCIANPLNTDRSAFSKDLNLPFNDSRTTSVTPANNAPPTEVDHDGDRRVECEYVKETWQGKSNVLGGEDCDDISEWAKTVYPAAPEYCDGVFNDCDAAGYDATLAPDDETDADEDGFVQCLPDDGVEWARDETNPNSVFDVQSSTIYLSSEVYFAYYVDSDGDCYCPNQISNADTSCDPDNCKDATGAVCTPTEGDCKALGGYGDCNDDPKAGGTSTHVAAEEICDGQYNDCRDQEWTEGDASTWPSNSDPENVPELERDDDGDAYVDCDTWSSDTWLGYGDVSVLGGDDCDDEDATIYPNAPESCDGMFNDCEDVLLQDYNGAVTTSGCYCNDDCDTSSCRDSSGGACQDSNPLTSLPDIDEDNDGTVDDCQPMTDPVTIGGVDFNTVHVSYYCEYSDCLYDPDGDGDANCVTPDGVHAPSIPNFTDADYADDCALSGVETVTFRDDFTAPSEETDNDDDGYVECDYNSATWLATIHPTGGNDCDDVDDTVFPTAEERCDGQYNDCDSPSGYSDTTAPADETDDDEDGWVECERQVTAPWNPAETNITDYEPNTWFGSLDSGFAGGGCFCPSHQSCEDELDGYVGDPPSSIESVAQCMDGSLNACVPLDCDDSAVPGDPEAVFTIIRSVEMYDCDDTVAEVHPASAPLDSGLACAEDSDHDDYGDENPTSTAAVDGTDCLDDNNLVHPNQPESCESTDPQVDSDCNGDTNSADGYNSLEGWIEGTHPEVYVDEDLDLYGDETLEAIEACETAPGYVTDHSDCDDRDADIHPNAPEICDDVDQDCDSAIDEATPLDPLDPETSGCISTYKDEDGDGYGDINAELCLCAPSNGTNPTYEGVSYTVFYGDCYDGVDIGATIKPLTCEDDFDNDGDGLPDSEDPDCIAGYTEVNASGSEKEERLEILDGHDNDCNGYVPAVELDCDDDRSLPMLPIEASGGSRPDTFQSARDLGLAFCDQVGENRELTCWNTTVALACDNVEASVDPDGDIVTEGSGLWMLKLVDGGFDGRYDGGARIYTSETAPAQGNCTTAENYSDCEDHCSARCESVVPETCDGLDSNCSSVDPGTDDDGIPDSLDEGITLAGTVSPNEIDLDADGYYSCDDFALDRNETQYTTASCADEFLTEEQTNDCESLCSLTFPDATESCDGFANSCDPAADPEGLDDDRDDLRTCGAWAGDSELEEDVFVVVWLKDVDWAKRGSEPKVLGRPAVAAPPAPPALSGDDTAPVADTAEDTGAPEADTAAEDTGSAPPPPPAATAATADAKDEDTEAADSDTIELADMVPLILPRDAANGSGIVTCDIDLYQQLALLLGEERLAEAMDPESEEDPNQILVEACEREDGFCTVVQLNLGEDVDERTYEEIIGTSGEFTGDCEDHPEQWIARAMWQHARILEARETVVEWECQRLYGKSCSNVVVGVGEGTDTEMLDGWQDAMPNAAQWLSTDSAWWKEIGVDRFNATSAHSETLLTCWGEPRGVAKEDNDISDKTGGDCDDASRDSHRDNPEGPDDLIGLYLGTPADCSTCLDGFDNNCDGNVDCADPACARCFIGQGVGCSRGEDAPCAQAGCAAGATGGSALLDRMFSAAVLALFAVLYRRRERR